jgi:hypothetical protein
MLQTITKPNLYCTISKNTTAASSKNKIGHLLKIKFDVNFKERKDKLLLVWARIIKFRHT